MKKNAMLKIAAILMVAVLLTTCAISSTFAKYTTSATGTDTARVAKFGITVTSDVDKALFAESYATTDKTYEGATTVQVDTTGTKLVAPGTAIAKAVNTKIEGTAEVAVRVSVEATLVLTGWTIDTDVEYCPIIFTVNGETYGTKDTAAKNKSETVELLIKAVEAAIEAATDDYAPNTVFAAADDKNDKTNEVVTGVDISWAWPYETTGNVNDVKDTKLGRVAATGTAPVITLTVTTTVTQID